MLVLAGCGENRRKIDEFFVIMTRLLCSYCDGLREWLNLVFYIYRLTWAGWIFL